MTLVITLLHGKNEKNYLFIGFSGNSFFCRSLPAGTLPLPFCESREF